LGRRAGGRACIHEATVIKEMVLEGIVGIVEGLNPTLIPAGAKAANAPQAAAAGD
jgi:uncharacterized protein YjeT (DUF2065 family)